MKIIYYSLDTGKVTKAIEGNSIQPEWNLAEGEGYLQMEFADNPHDYYVADGSLVQRHELDVTVDGSVIKNIPPGSEAIVDEFGAVIVDDGELELDANFSGPVYIVVNHPHYKTEALTVTL